MDFIIRSKEEAKREFERVKRHLKSFEIKKDKVIITIAYFGHEVEEKDIYTFTDYQAKNTFTASLMSWERLNRWDRILRDD